SGIAVIATAIVAPAILKRWRGHERAVLYGAILALTIIGTLPVLFTNFWPLLVFRFLIGVPIGFLFPSVTGLIAAEFEPEDRARVLGWSSLSLSGQAFLYTLISGYLGRYSYRLVFLLTLTTVPVVLFSMYTGLSVRQGDTMEAEGEGEVDLEAAVDAVPTLSHHSEGSTDTCSYQGGEKDAEGKRETEADRVVAEGEKVDADEPVPPFPLLRALRETTLFLMTQGTWFIYIVCVALHLDLDMGIDDSFIAGVAISCNTLGQMLGATFTAAVQRKYPSYGGPFYFVIQAVGLFLAATHTLSIVCTGGFLIGVGCGGLLPLLLGKASMFHESHRNTVGSMMMSFQNIGMMVFPLFSTLFSTNARTLAFGGVLAVGATLVWSGLEWRDAQGKGEREGLSETDLEVA
ncbi:major facilitator superfamily protein, partial [Kipferlia bialata]